VARQPGGVPHTVSAPRLNAVRQAAAATLGKNGAAPKIVPGPFFSPPSHAGTIYAFSPGSLGGSDWPPSSYNPNTQMLYGVFRHWRCGDCPVGAGASGCLLRDMCGMRRCRS